MKIVRVPIAVSLALLAAAPAAAVVDAPKPAPASQASSEAKPADAANAAAAPAEAPKPAGTQPRAPGDGFSLPAWLTDTGLPVWAWGGLGLVAFLVLRGLFRRDDRRDLLGPPRSLARRAAAPPPARPVQSSVPRTPRR